jgi:predicted nucleic acid-binding protein
LSLIEAGELEACVSVVTLTEVYYKYLRGGRKDLALTRTEQIRHASYLKKCLIDEETAIKAGEFKGKYGIPIADAFIAATAHSEGATIISDDPDFRKVSEVKVLTETEFHHELKE